jgi:hypothetical protein
LAAELAARAHPVVEGARGGDDEGGRRQTAPVGAKPLIVGVSPRQGKIECVAECVWVQRRFEEFDNEFVMTEGLVEDRPDVPVFDLYRETAAISVWRARTPLSWFWRPSGSIAP